MLHAETVVGSFVRVEDEPLGIGKYIGLSGERVQVEWFTSVNVRETREYPSSRIYLIHPPRQNRCYIHDSLTGDWSMGRIIGPAGPTVEGQPTPMYRVRLQGGKDDVYFPVNEIYVRCLGPAADPVDTLALLAHDTPYFHTRRAQCMDNFTRQRAVACGLLSVLSSKIRLYPHQFAIVQRVLEDPIQRYLLADEVGLGKTIEAGAIVRQVLMDCPSARALILTPPQLEEQWHSELVEKFGLTDASQVLVRRTTDIDRIDFENVYDILVIDEAHHIASGAHASPESPSHYLYTLCRRLAAQTPRLLLLSATPAINHEEDFLAMLHLLDPVRYQIEDVDRFRRMVEDRQPIGRLLLALPENIARPPLRHAISKLRQLFPEDGWVQQKVDRLQEQYDADTMDRGVVGSVIRELRVHICESHRIFQRMLRTSRRILGEELHWRGGGGNGVSDIGIEPGMDEAMADYFQRLEDWRMAAATHVWRANKDSGADYENLDRTRIAMDYGEVYATLVECAGWLPLVTHAVLLRLGLASQAAFALPEDMRLALTVTPLFPGESELLNAMRETLSGSSYDGGDEAEDQMSLLIDVVRQFRRKHAGKIVIFTQFTLAADEMLRRLRRAFPGEQLLSYLENSSENELQSTAHRFEHERGSNILVCDRRGEEGLNLQFTDLLIHFDLPWNVNRIEQRIGRVDRIGRCTPIQMKVLLAMDDEAAPDDVWLTLLRRGFKVFSESVTDLQFYLSDKTPFLKARALCHGPEALVKQISAVRVEAANERTKLAEQSALDEIEAFGRTDTAAFDRLVEFDTQHEIAQRSLEAWAVDAIQLEREPAPWVHGSGPGMPIDVRYEPTSSTLYPDAWKDRLRDAQTGFSTFDRERALQRPGLGLLRIGSPFVDTLKDMLGWDDRGQAFALWRMVKHGAGEPSGVWYRIDYFLEADRLTLQSAVHLVNFHESTISSLERRADALYPPERVTVFLNEQGEFERDPQTLRLLRLEYRAVKEGGTDYNLDHERLQFVQHVLPKETWARNCYEARRLSDELIRRDPEFERRSVAVASRVDQVWTRQSNYLRLKRQMEEQYLPMTDSEESLAAESKLYEAVFDAVRNPRIIADAMGVIILSKQNPFPQPRRIYS